MSERHFDSQRDRDALDRHITAGQPEPDDFPTREQHERISALAIDFAPAPLRVDPDVGDRLGRVEVGTYGGQTYVFDENGEDVTAEHVAPLAIQVRIPLDVVAVVLGVKDVSNAVAAATGSWGRQRGMVEAALSNKLAEPFVAKLRERVISASIRDGA